MPVIIDGTLGVNAAAITTTNWTPTNIATGGNTTLGDASGDTVTINAATLSAPNNLNINSNLLYIDNANGRIGIGTNSPLSKFHVNGNVSVGTNNYIASNLYYDNASSSWKYIGNGYGAFMKLSEVTGIFQIQQAANNSSGSGASAGSLTEPFRIDVNGKIGIGLGGSNPSELVHVKSSGDTVIRLDSSYAGAKAYNITTGGNGNYSPGVFAIRNVTDATTPFAIYGDNVGIGTTSPVAKLDIGGSAAGQALVFSSTAGNANPRVGGAIGITAPGISGYKTAIDFNYSSYNDIFDIRFYTQYGGSGSTERVRIDSSGNVGIGTAGVTSVTSKLTLARLMDANEWNAFTIANAGSWSVYPNSISRINFTDGAGTVGTIGVGFNGQGYLTIGNFYTSNYGTSGEIMRVNGTGSVVFPKGQLQFPASQNASSDPNTLDDYEEGTHTTTVTVGSGSVTSYTSRTLQYVKIGRQVTIWGRLHVNLSATNVTSFKFTLPFALAYGNGGSDEAEIATVAQVIRATANTGTSGAGPDGIRIFRGISSTSTMTMQTADGGETGNFGVTNPHINFQFSYYTTA